VGWLLLLGIGLVGTASAQGVDGEVTVPLARWERTLAAIEAGEAPVIPPEAVLPIDRSVTGRFERGVFSGALSVTFEIPEGAAPARVPVLDGGSAIGAVRLNGQSTSLLREGGVYTVGVEEAGRHKLTVDFFQGREDDRFARELRLALPPGGPTRVAVRVPEAGVSARLGGGALTAVTATRGGTLIEGQLDALSAMDLSWERPLAEQDLGPARTELVVNTLFTLDEALVRGVSAVDVRVVEGTIDRVALDLPEGVEIVDVEGEDVLQWHTAPGRVTALLRYRVDDRASVRVHFQFPAALDQPVALKMPRPEGGVGYDGAVGVQGPAGLEVDVRSAEGARQLAPRDLPAALVGLTGQPLLMGFDFDAAPAITLGLTRNEAVELTSTLVDDVQASTVLLEDGAEITKVRMRVRNNPRQYLGVTLPEGALLTHARIDGQPVKPALQSGSLQIPLRQSERVAPGEDRWHTVLPNETLGGIADRYYGDTTQWQRLMDANADTLLFAEDLFVGQELLIPPAGAGDVEESSFVLELAWRGAGEPLGFLGRRTVSLPAMDVDSLGVTWHLYLPDAVEPLRFDANLSPTSNLRYDPLRRFQQFLDRARWTRDAWASGGGVYSSILTRRKAIYQQEVGADVAESDVLGAFPLVGERYRFERLLPGRDTPEIRVAYVDAAVLPHARRGAFLAAFLLALLGLRSRGRGQRAGAAVGFLALLWAAHHILGFHRRILWGVDLALFLELARGRGPALRAAGRRLVSGRLMDWLSWTNLAAAFGAVILLQIALARPLLLSTAALVVMSAARWRWRRSAAVGAAATLALAVGWPAQAGGGDEEDAWHAEREDIAQKNFDTIMLSNDRPAAAAPAQRLQSLGYLDGLNEVSRVTSTHVEDSASARIPLARWEEARGRLEALNVAAADTPLVVLGSSRYRGEAVEGALDLDLTMQVTLTGDDIWKTVPLVGEEVVVVSASVAGRPVPLSRMSGYHVWHTREAGEVTLDLEILVPAHGREGSLEYDFLVARTPETRFDCVFPAEGLEPRLRGAVRAEVTPAAGETRLSARVRPTSRVHLVGYRDMSGEDEALDARVYAESLSLVSVAEGAVDLFTAVRYDILHAGLREFRVQIPEGMRVVSAEGEGGFRYTVAGDQLIGETAYPIRGDYEISLRLTRELPGAGEPFSMTPPRPLAVERAHGWVGVEVTGNLLLEELGLEEALGVDVRQLPWELVNSAVSPVLRAYRYHEEGAELTLSASSLPEVEPEGATVDAVRAVTVIAEEGRVLTDLRITLRNRLRHSLALTLPAAGDWEVRSALLGDKPIKPSLSADGSLLLPLERSAGDEAFTLQVVLEGDVDALGLLGARSLTLPSLALPVSSLEWSVYAPARNSYSELRGVVEPQRWVGQGGWYQAPVSHGGGGAPGGASAGGMAGDMPVRIEIPRSGKQLTVRRYWIPAEAPVTVSTRYVRSWLVAPAKGAGGLGLLALIVFAWRRNPQLQDRLGPGPLARIRAARATLTASGAPSAWSQRTALGKLVLLSAGALVGLMLFTQSVRLLSVLSNPL